MTDVCPCHHGPVSGERVLVNFVYAHNVGHAVEALHYCLGDHAADPTREIAVALNAATAIELVGFCPFVSQAFAVDHPLLEPCPDSAARQAELPRRWEWVLDDFRRRQRFQLALFPGLRDYYLTSDRLLTAVRGRTVVGSDPPGYVPHQQLRLELPGPLRASAAERFARQIHRDGAGRVALMPAGLSDRALYPATGSWLVILDALADAFPGVQIALIGKRTRDVRTATSLDADELAELLMHHSRSGGRWFEYVFNRVPFRSIIPDTDRYPSFTQFVPAATVDEGSEGPRTPSMSRSRIGDDLDRIVAAAGDLLRGSLTYDQSLRDYFEDLVTAHGGDSSAIWSIDNVHLDYVPAS